MTGFKKIGPPSGSDPYQCIYRLDAGDGNRTDPEIGMQSLREAFPDEKKINHANFVFFSTSGVHGSYIELEDIESSLRKYGDDFDPGDDEPADWRRPHLTVLIVQTRIVCLRFGNVRVRLADIPYLKKIRKASKKAVAAFF